MKPVTIAIIPALAATLVATSALAQHAPSAPVHGSQGSVRGPVAYGAPAAQSRVQQWYSDTGWQPGPPPAPDAVQSYGYGYGGAGHSPQAIIAPTPEPLQQAQSRSFQPSVTRSMPFGYVVDGFGRYPWQRGATYQSAAQSHMPVQAQAYHGPQHHSQNSAPCPHHPPVMQAMPASPRCSQEPVPLPQPPDTGYFAVPAPAPVSPTEIPYRQEGGERG